MYVAEPGYMLVCWNRVGLGLCVRGGWGRCVLQSLATCWCVGMGLTLL